MKTRTKLAYKVNEFHESISEALQALADAEANIYVHGGLLVHIVQDEAGSSHASPMKRHQLRALLNDHIEWRGAAVVDGVRATKRIVTPMLVVDSILARDTWPELRSLHGIVDTPILRPDGTILMKRGYDPQTKLVYHSDLVLPDIPESPSLDDAKQALETLLDITCDFPFARPADKSACMAAMLTPFVRHAFSGPAPLCLFDANTRGSGKTLLAKAMAYIPLGYEIPCMPPADDDREERKRITAIAMRGDRAVLIDNVASKLGTPSLDSALTSTRWQDRILGGNSTFDGQLLACWFATGNNVAFAGDTARRTLHIRLDAMMDNPEERSKFKYPNLLKTVKKRRLDLVVAALTLIRGWYAAGAPEQKVRPWGSFEGWTSIVPQILVWAGMEDPSVTREELVDEAESDKDTLRDLLTAMREYDPKGLGTTARQIAEDFTNDPEGTAALREALSERIRTRGLPPTANQIGLLFRAVRRRVVDGWFLSGRKSMHGVLWSVEKSRAVSAENHEPE